MLLQLPFKQFATATFLLFTLVPALGQQLPVIKANTPKAKIRIGTHIQEGSWGIDASVKPDILDVYVPAANIPVTFITDQDSIQFQVKPNSFQEFVILVNGKDSARTAIKGIPIVPRAHYSEEYKKSHSGKTSVEIPAFYELINIVFALTAEGRKDNGLIMKNTPYYTDVMQWFDKFSDEPVVKSINAELSESDAYSALKMDAYSFGIEGKKVVKSPVYDRIGFSNSNNLQHQVAGLQDFLIKSNFPEFFAKHQPYYNELIVTYRDSIGVPEMQKWLNTNFPTTRYESFKIIFSPLVAGNQSATWFNYDGFKEAQAHVNFPFRNRKVPHILSNEAQLVAAGSILFTELNHAFINPESEKPEYVTRIQKAFTDLSVWNDPDKPAKYYESPSESFNEYMNWALVCLRYADYAPKSEQQRLISDTEKMLVEMRGFRKFAAFDQFLVPLYKNRKKGQVLAGLYPQIVAWFEKNGK
jgi:hypothetical protein